MAIFDLTTFDLVQSLVVLIGLLALFVVRAVPPSTRSIPRPSLGPWPRGAAVVVLLAVALALMTQLVFMEDPDASDFVMALALMIGYGLGGYTAVYLAERFTRARGFGFFASQILEFLALLVGFAAGAFVGDVADYLLYGDDFFWQQSESGLLDGLFFDVWVWLTLILWITVGSVRLFYNVRLFALDRQQQQQEMELLQLRDQATRAQLQSIQARINPHFLYNALNSIASLIPKAPDRAERMTLDLARLFRAALDTDASPMTTLRQELALVETYLSIEATRFGERLAYTIEADDATLDAPVPRFVLQPLVENAVKHGIARATQTGRIRITARRDGQTLHLTVADNGPDFPKDLVGGYGLQSVQESLALLFPDRHALTFRGAPDKQVEIRLELPA